MGYVGRKRWVDEYLEYGTYHFPNVAPNEYFVSQKGLEAVSSQANPGWIAYQRTGQKGPRADMGSQFIVARYNLDCGHLRISGTSTGRVTVQGPFIPVQSTTQNWELDWNLWGPNPATGRMFLPTFPSDLNGQGATAISRCAPTSPHADLATAIGELAHDGIPSLTSATLKGRERGTFKGVANDNLKAQFELLPLVSDIKSLHSAIRDRGKILAQYARDSGRSVHRTYRFPVDTSTTTVYKDSTAKGGPWPLLSDVFTSTGTLTRVTETRTETWFSGSFVYHRAGNDTQWSSVLQKYQDLNHLLGAGIGPQLAWNLTPWSWAVDWFTNTGDVMKNVQMMMNDGLIMEYGFVMRTQTITDMYTRNGARLRGGYICDRDFGTLPLTWPATVTRTIKWRNQANPFGFGITFPSLSGRQMSILASLGITRDSRVP